MPSPDHEDLAELFDTWPELAVDLLVWGGRPVPAMVEAISQKGSLTEQSAPGHRADAVVVLRGAQGRAVLVIVVEIQRGRDPRKRYTWPLYEAALKSRYECPVVLVVVPLGSGLAAWVRRTFERIRADRREPLSMADAHVPAITDVEEAKQAPARAVFSAVWHARNADTSLAVRVAHAALQACVGLARELGQLYSALIDRSLPIDVAQELEALMTSLGQSKRGYLGQRVFEEGREEGRDERRLEALALTLNRLLALRFGTIPDWAQARVAAASAEDLNLYIDRVLSEGSLEAVLRA